jgi:hypothetical protein
MITELGKRCQEMARIEDCASFKSEHLGALGNPQTPHPGCFLVCLPHLKNE